ncbi:hypothetical protein [Rufibacter psychrotolerans]|uniref:hypothetical protein n=1 Tax=Rufibacter psychrotolerans TaxID=2812556 RepID=UPI0019671F7C|nr:hypothetical protein [Rufibacter sp. SYSU D00308]
MSCSPKKDPEDLAVVPVTADSLEEVVDSVANVREDGTATASTPPLDVKQQLPAELEVHLDRTHGLWQLPVLTDQDIQRVPPEEQGPYYLEADFNGDRQKDYAIQLLERDSAFVYAFIKEKDDFKEYLLERHQLFDIAGKQRSIRYLTLAKKNGKYYDYTTRKSMTIPQDGISVGAENYTATYVWEKSGFRKFETGD